MHLSHFPLFDTLKRSFRPHSYVGVDVLGEVNKFMLRRRQGSTLEWEKGVAAQNPGK